MNQEDSYAFPVFAASPAMAFLHFSAWLLTAPPSSLPDFMSLQIHPRYKHSVLSSSSCACTKPWVYTFYFGPPVTVIALQSLHSTTSRQRKKLSPSPQISVSDMHQIVCPFLHLTTNSAHLSTTTGTRKLFQALASKEKGQGWEYR